MLVKKEFPTVRFNDRPFDIVFIDASDPDSLTHHISQNKLHNNTMMLIGSIHKNKESQEFWDTLKKLKNSTVTIDMFNCGAIFFRKEQVKEHFIIRI